MKLQGLFFNALSTLKGLSWVASGFFLKCSQVLELWDFDGLHRLRGASGLGLGELGFLRSGTVACNQWVLRCRNIAAVVTVIIISVPIGIVSIIAFQWLL